MSKIMYHKVNEAKPYGCEDFYAIKDRKGAFYVVGQQKMIPCRDAEEAAALASRLDTQRIFEYLASCLFKSGLYPFNYEEHEDQIISNWSGDIGLYELKQYLPNCYTFGCDGPNCLPDDPGDSIYYPYDRDLEITFFNYDKVAFEYFGDDSEEPTGEQSYWLSVRFPSAEIPWFEFITEDDKCIKSDPYPYIDLKQRRILEKIKRKC